MFSFGRTVLSMMDDALYVYKTAGGGADFVESVPWDQDGFISHVVGLIQGACGNAPVVILNDMIEQYYRKERVFTAGVGTLDKKSMVDRKLAMVFPSYSVRTSIALNEKIKREDSKIASDVYLFAAIASSDQLSSVVTSVSRSTAASKGVGLLPLESVGLVENLVKKLVPKGKAASKWSLLIGQHRNGNLRQIVVKDGDIALTRMTQITEESSPEVWAADVIQEFQSTMNYLSRLGFQAKDGLDVILIGPGEEAEPVRQAVEGKYAFYNATAGQAAALLGLKIADQDNERYADLLHMAWVAKKFTLSASLPVGALEPVAQARMAASGAMVVLAASALFMVYNAGASFLSVLSTGKDLSDQETRLSRLERDYKQESARLADMGLDLPLIQATAAAYSQIGQNEVALLPLIEAIGGALEGGRVLNKMEVSIVDHSATKTAGGAGQSGRPARGAAQAPRKTYEATLVMVFPDDTAVDLGNKELSDFRTRLRQALPSHDIEVTKFLDDKQYRADVGGGNAENQVRQDMVAEISIKGVEAQ